MTKVTYLFGAGASANCLPIVSQIPDEIRSCIAKLTTHRFTPAKDESEFLDDSTFYNGLRELCDDLSWLLEKTMSHASVDTFAKKLYLRQETADIQRLRIVLSVFFIYIQLIKSPDPRYDAFFASIIKDYAKVLPKNVRIVSWNYDQQFEIAYSNLVGESGLENIQKALNVTSKHNVNDYTDGYFSIFKLNGMTELYDHQQSKYQQIVPTIGGSLTQFALSQLVSKYIAAKRNPTRFFCPLSFAWDTGNQDLQLMLDRTIAAIEDSSVLVVIGYSFPFFNREIDRRLIKSMHSLKKVYLQSPEATNIKERFDAITEDRVQDFKCVLRNDVYQFHLPNEL